MSRPPCRWATISTSSSSCNTPWRQLHNNFFSISWNRAAVQVEASRDQHLNFPSHKCCRNQPYISGDEAATHDRTTKQPLYKCDSEERKNLNPLSRTYNNGGPAAGFRYRDPAAGSSQSHGVQFCWHFAGEHRLRHKLPPRRFFFKIASAAGDKPREEPAAWVRQNNPLLQGRTAKARAKCDTGTGSYANRRHRCRNNNPA